MSSLPTVLPILSFPVARTVLRTSQGFPNQWNPAMLERRLRGQATPSGHAMSRHAGP